MAQLIAKRWIQCCRCGDIFTNYNLFNKDAPSGHRCSYPPMPYLSEIGRTLTDGGAFKEFWTYEQ